MIDEIVSFEIKIIVLREQISLFLNVIMNLHLVCFAKIKFVVKTILLFMMEFVGKIIF